MPNFSHGTYVLLQKENEKKGNIKWGSANRNVCGASLIGFVLIDVLLIVIFEGEIELVVPVLIHYLKWNMTVTVVIWISFESVLMFISASYIVCKFADFNSDFLFVRSAVDKVSCFIKMPAVSAVYACAILMAYINSLLVYAVRVYDFKKVFYYICN